MTSPENALLGFSYDIQKAELFPNGSGSYYAKAYFARLQMRPQVETVAMGATLPATDEDIIEYVDECLPTVGFFKDKQRHLAAAIIIMRLRINLDNPDSPINLNLDHPDNPRIDISIDDLTLEPVKALIIADDAEPIRGMVARGVPTDYLWTVSSLVEGKKSTRSSVREETAIHMPLGRTAPRNGSRAEVIVSSRNDQVEPVLVISRGIETVIKASRVATQAEVTTTEAPRQSVRDRT